MTGWLTDRPNDWQVDLWEFCVHMQKRSEGLTAADLNLEIEQAFMLFRPDEDGCVDEKEMRRLLVEHKTAAQLDEAEFLDFLEDIAMRGMGDVRNGGKINLRCASARESAPHALCTHAHDDPPLSSRLLCLTTTSPFVSLCVRNNRDLKRHPCYQAGAAEAFTNDNAPAPDLPLSPLAKPPATAMAEVPMWPPASEEEGGEEPAVRGSMKPE